MNENIKLNRCNIDKFQESDNILHPQTNAGNVLLSVDSNVILRDWILSGLGDDMKSNLIEWLKTYYPTDTENTNIKITSSIDGNTIKLVLSVNGEEKTSTTFTISPTVAKEEYSLKLETDGNLVLSCNSIEKSKVDISSIIGIQGKDGVNGENGINGASAIDTLVIAGLLEKNATAKDYYNVVKGSVGDRGISITDVTVIATKVSSVVKITDETDSSITLHEPTEDDINKKATTYPATKTTLKITLSDGTYVSRDILIQNGEKGNDADSYVTLTATQLTTFFSTEQLTTYSANILKCISKIDNTSILYLVPASIFETVSTTSSYK